jgi:hypothetical protein
LNGDLQRDFPRLVGKTRNFVHVRAFNGIGNWEFSGLAGTEFVAM